MRYSGTSTKCSPTTTYIVGTYNHHRQTTVTNHVGLLLGILVTTLLAIGHTEATLQDSGTEHLSMSFSPDSPSKHAVHHFTLYQQKQGNKHTKKDEATTQIELTKRHHNSLESDTVYETAEPSISESCTITVDDERVSDNNCNCEQYLNKSNGLDDALNCAKQNMNAISLEINLVSEKLLLFQTHDFVGASGIHLTGMPTVIVCNRTKNSGLRFWNSTNIVLENIALLSCGAWHQSMSKNFINHSLTVTSQSAIHVSHCSDMIFRNVNITKSEGTGLTMVNCSGIINITGSYFTNNTISKDFRTPGGGGVSIELLGGCFLAQCKRNTMHGTNCTDDSHATYNISNSTFSGNTASSGKYRITHITSNKDSYFSYGQGGGLSVNFGDTCNKHLVITNSHFRSNTAQRGGGLFVGFREWSQRNDIDVDNVFFEYNQCLPATRPPGANYSSGGAAKVIYFTNSKQSKLYITGSKFTNNAAFFGGALSMGGGTNYYGATYSNITCTFLLTKCEFEHNKGRIGSAIDLYYRISVKDSNHGSAVFPCISDSNFTQNGDLYYYTDHSTGRTFATIYLVYIPSKFYGIINVVNNSASGFGIEEAMVHFEDNALVNVANNTATIGGGMALIGRSTVILHKNTTIKFVSNLATDKGGAIFSSQVQERYIAYDFTCFFQYNDTVSGPSQWNATIMFSNNKAINGTNNDIYASSLLPCVWPSSATSDLRYDMSQTFCGWNSTWKFDTSDVHECRKLIRTAPSRFSKTSFKVEVIPGNLTKIEDFYVLDDLQHNISKSAIYTVSKTTLRSLKEEQPSDLEVVVTNHGILLTTINETYMNHTVSIVLQTADRKSITTQINVTILPCPPGYILDSKQRGACVCSKQHSFGGAVTCNASQITSYIFAGYCITYSKIKKKPEYIVARCPYVVGSLTFLYNEIPPNLLNHGDKFCKALNRSHELCGKCKQGYGLDVYSTNFKCIPCSNTHTGIQWVKVVAASTLPTTLLFTLCTVFHISITTAHTNGYIFFSHVITMRLDILMVQYAWEYFKHNESTLTDLLYVPYQLWTFDFPQIVLNDICLGKSFKVAHAIALQYLSVLYPLLLVLTAIILIELHAKNFKPLVWLWKPLCYLCVRFRHSWQIRTSVIDTFASFLLLSYSNLIGVSMSLLTPTNVITSNGRVVKRILQYDTSMEFFGGTHFKYGVFAIIILSTFGAIPPILLILYPFKWFQYLLNKCNLKGRRFLQVFVDAFQGSYKNNVKGYPERRYFAGVYFLFRIAINVIYMAVEDMVKLHLTLTLTYISFTLIILAQRPYKKNFYNILDGSFMGLLVFIHALTMYLLHHALAFRHIPQKVWYFTYTIQHIPTLYMILLVVYLVSFRMRCVKRFFRNHFGGKVMFFKSEGFDTEKNSPNSPLMNHDWPSSSSLVIPSPSSPHGPSKNLSDIPDRVDNPQRYEPLVDSWQFSNRRGDHDFIEAESKSKSTKYGSVY